eukprot:5106970-Lingulodinium_polyedra.AAC.1
MSRIRPQQCQEDGRWEEDARRGWEDGRMGGGRDDNNWHASCGNNCRLFAPRQTLANDPMQGIPCIQTDLGHQCAVP